MLSFRMLSLFKIHSLCTSLERQARRPVVHNLGALLASRPSVCYSLAFSLSSSLYKSAQIELEKATPGLGREFVCFQLAQQVFYFRGDV